VILCCCVLLGLLIDHVEMHDEDVNDRCGADKRKLNRIQLMVMNYQVMFNVELIDTELIHAHSSSQVDHQSISSTTDEEDSQSSHDNDSSNTVSSNDSTAIQQEAVVNNEQLQVSSNNNAATSSSAPSVSGAEVNQPRALSWKEEEKEKEEKMKKELILTVKDITNESNQPIIDKNVKKLIKLLVALDYSPLSTCLTKTAALCILSRKQLLIDFIRFICLKFIFKDWNAKLLSPTVAIDEVWHAALRPILYDQITHCVRAVGGE
jgi:hypothetical protein